MTKEDEQGPTGANFAARSARLGELELAGGQAAHERWCVQLVLQIGGTEYTSSGARGTA